MPNKLIDMRGWKCGWLTVIEKIDNRYFRTPQWRCECKCGRRIIASGPNLRSGNTRSCGCLPVKLKAIADAAVAEFMRAEFEVMQ